MAQVAFILPNMCIKHTSTHLGPNHTHTMEPVWISCTREGPWLRPKKLHGRSGRARIEATTKTSAVQGESVKRRCPYISRLSAAYALSPRGVQRGAATAEAAQLDAHKNRSIEASILFASKSTSTCGVKRTWVSTSSVSPFRQAIGALLSPTAAHASRLEELQIGALRAGEASGEWDKSSRI